MEESLLSFLEIDNMELKPINIKHISCFSYFPGMYHFYSKKMYQNGDIEILKKILSKIELNKELVRLHFVYKEWVNPINEILLKDYGLKCQSKVYLHFFGKKNVKKENTKLLESLREGDVPTLQKYHHNVFSDSVISFFCLNFSILEIVSNFYQVLVFVMTKVNQYLHNLCFGHLYITSEYRRKGYAQKLMNDILSKSKYEYGGVGIKFDNVPSLNLFQKKLGYKKLKKEFYLLKYQRESKKE